MVCKKIKSKIKDCQIYVVSQTPKCLKKFDFIFFICPNTGDEELPEDLENYLFNLKTKNKNYFLCELGNYLGFEYYGCKKIVISILKKLKWKLRSVVAIDSIYSIDEKKLNEWIEVCKSKIKLSKNDIPRK